MHNSKKELPEMHRTVLALLEFGDVPPLPLTGFIAETIDTHEKYFHAFNKIGYSTELIRKWDYLNEIVPGYCMINKEETMEQQQIKIFTDAESEIYFCAFRYCLGRKSYVVSDFCEEAMRKIKQINDHFLLLLEKELVEAARQDDTERANGEIPRTLGWDCDRVQWLEFTKTVSAEIDRRQLIRRV